MRSKFKRLFIVVLLVFGLVIIPNLRVNSATNLSVHFINVGEGLSVLVKFPDGKTMLYDAGPYSERQTVVNYIKNQGVKKIDFLVFSHPDADHIGGGSTVIKTFSIGSIYMPKVSNTTKTFEDLLTTIKDKKLTIKEAKNGVSISGVALVNIRFIGPTSYLLNDTNNNSAVLSITYKKVSILLTGDAEEKEEKAMISNKTLSQHTILQVAHHGSKYSTTNAFLSVVKPKYAIISVGKNSYGHPTKEVLDRLKSYNVKIYRTDLQGNIVVSTNGSEIDIKANK